VAQAIEPKSAAQADKRLTVTKILAATDFSPASDLALDYALALARRCDAQIYLAHVVPPESVPDAEKFPAQTGPDATWQAAEHGMAAILVSGKLRAIPHEVLLERGSVWPVLEHLIEKHEIDLIVTGTHSRTRINKASMGAVAEEVFQLADCAVMTVGPRVVKSTEAGDVGLRNILFATDFGPETEGTATYAFALAQEHGARVTMLHVIQETKTRKQAGPEEQPVFSVDRLEQLVPPGADNWSKAECRASFGRVAKEILALARETSADLIVMSAERKSSSADDGASSIPYNVIAKAHCPVLTVRNRLSHSKAA